MISQLRGAQSLVQNNGDRELPVTTRAYQRVMAKEHRGFVPDFGDIVDLASGYRTVTDDTRQKQFAHALERTMTGVTAGGGGFALPVGVADQVFDRARQTVTPASLVEWYTCPPGTGREMYFPVSYEQNTAVPYSGFTPTWGDNETTVPAAVDSKLATIRLSFNRLLLYTQLSQDVRWDAPMLNRWIRYSGTAAIRTALVNALLYGSSTNGTFGSPCPQGVLTSSVAVPVTRATGSTIKAVDIANLWSSIHEGCQQSDRITWHCQGTTLATLNNLSASNELPPLIYMPAGTSPLGTPFGTIFGKPLIPIPEAPALGNAGDLFVIDWSQ
jgi:HK97 family phage major capsid protein